MRLYEHPDFEQAILRAADHFRPAGLRPAVIEKDYFVTEALRIISVTSGDKIIFKGGTSLSKGWNLIQRFSEDIDIFLDPLAFTPALVKRSIDRELKLLRDAVASHPALSFVPNESITIGGFGRSDRFAYEQRFGGPGEVANRVLLEAGTASGREPTTTVQLSSYLAQFLKETNVTLNAEDEKSFPMRLLHFRRTFVEKMFAIHAKVEMFKQDGRPIGTYPRASTQERTYSILRQRVGLDAAIWQKIIDEFPEVTPTALVVDSSQFRDSAPANGVLHHLLPNLATLMTNDSH